MSVTIKYRVTGSLLPVSDSVRLSVNEDPLEALCRQVVDTISCDVMVEINGVKQMLAAWMDPDHWSQEWEEAGTTPSEVLGC
jgi:hypothetical protein